MSPVPLPSNSDPTERGRPRFWASVEVLLIFLIFFIHGAWPVPEVNEAHYLSKAKHYWNPDWCANDFFCDSADAHQVFYWSFGWLTLWLPLPAVAWIGRVLTWGLLAYGSRRLSVALVPVRLAAVLSAALFLTLLHRGHMAGEWVVGGVEAKGFAFFFGLLGIEAIVRNRWDAAWLWFGLASAFHVLVGGWLVVAAGFAWVALRVSSEDKPKGGHLWALVVGGLLALPGLVPALLLMRGVDPATAAEAARIYVYERLPHHLVARTFVWDFLLRFIAMVLVWWWVARQFCGEAVARRLIALVNGSLLIAVVGLCIGFAETLAPTNATTLLRYYWFRTSDVMLPLGLGLLLARSLCGEEWFERRDRPALLAIAMLFIALHLGSVIQSRGPGAIPPADRKMLNASDWREVCQWVRENTPEEAIFLTPKLASTFRWYAQRAEVVTWKDIPQDAQGIVEWWRRFCDLYDRRQFGSIVRWRSSLSDAPPEDLVRLGKEYGAEFLITQADPPLPFELVSPPNPSYSVYRIPKEWNPSQPRLEPTP